MNVEPGSPPILFAIAATVEAAEARALSETARSQALLREAQDRRAEAVRWLEVVGR